MSNQQIAFLVVGIFCFLLDIPLFIWWWKSYKNPTSENLLRRYNWFVKWIVENKATIILLVGIVVLLCGIGFTFGVTYSDGLS